MNENFTYWSDLVDKKIQNKLSEQDNAIFKTLIAENSDFKKFYEQQKRLALGIQLAERQRLKKALKMQLQQENESVAVRTKNRFLDIFWLSQYSAAIWLIAISMVITLSGVVLYRTWQKQQYKKQLAIQWQQAEELLDEPNKKQEIILSKPNAVQSSPVHKESTKSIPQPAPPQEKVIEKNTEKLTYNEKHEIQTTFIQDTSKLSKNDIKQDTLQAQKTITDEIPQPLADINTPDTKEKKASKMEAKQKSNIREFYLPVYALRIQDEIQNRNYTANPENIRSGKDMPRATKTTVGPKIFVTQYIDRKVQDNNVWYYDFTRDGSGEHLFIYADFDVQALQLYIDRNPSPVKYYLKTPNGVFTLYPNQIQKQAEPVTDKKILRYVE